MRSVRPIDAPSGVSEPTYLFTKNSLLVRKMDAVYSLDTERFYKCNVYRSLGYSHSRENENCNYQKRKRDFRYLSKARDLLVGTARFELTTSRTPSERATRLRYVP